MSISEHPLYIQLFKKLEPGSSMTEFQMVLFFCGLLILSIMQHKLAPIQPIKTFFLIITCHFFLNFFYSFHAKVTLEKMLTHHIKLGLLLCVSLINFFIMSNCGWLFISLNIIFFIKLIKKLFSHIDRKWNLMILLVNVLCFILLTVFNKIEMFMNEDGSHEYEITGFFDFKYLSYSMLPLFICSLMFSEDFERQNENIYHLGNLLDFIMICFLPFLFVIQKDQDPPMKNIFGYVMLIPLIIIGTFCLALFYFFISNLKSLRLFSIINMICIFYIFVANDIFLSYIARAIFMVVIFLLCLNFPMANRIASNPFDENEPLDDEILNGSMYKKQNLKLSNNLEIIKESDEERKYGSGINSIRREATDGKDELKSEYSIELKENKLEENLLNKN